MNLVGADVRRLRFPSEIKVSLLTSAPAKNRKGSWSQGMRKNEKRLASNQPMVWADLWP